MYKKKVLAILVLAMLALSIIQVFNPVTAAPVTTPGVLEWITPNGEANHADLGCNPEWLKVRTATYVSHETEIIVHGKDKFGQDVEGKALIPVGKSEREFPLIDMHSGEKVTFAGITAVLQQGGEHCNVFEIKTLPTDKEIWLGLYTQDEGYKPRWEGGFPREPPNPEPLKVVINWQDKNGDNLPDPDEFPNPPSEISTIAIEGLDQYGNILKVTVAIPAGSTIVLVNIADYTWSTVCTVREGELGISYYIFTEPALQRPILRYNIAVHHIRVTADPKNILADGVMNSTITITLLDIDGHEVHWKVGADPIEINVAATGGKVKPSLGIKIKGCNTNATTTLISDTNARIVKVSVLAMVPETERHPYMELTGSDIVCFDGINSVPYEPVLDIFDIGGTGSGRYYAVFRMLSEGCNLISIPVIPDEELTWDMLPCADQSLISVATYNGTDWLYYDFVAGTGDTITIKDGCAYWVKTEKPCTLVISGRIMDQYDDDTGFGLPPMYKMKLGWNFVGVTSIQMPIPTAEYLESLNIEQAVKLWGPVWIYRWGQWIRNPTELWPTEGMWLFTYNGILAP